MHFLRYNVLEHAIMTDVPLVYVFILIVFMIILTADSMGFGVAFALISATVGIIALLSRNESMTAAPAATPAAPVAKPPADPLRDQIMPWQQQDPIPYSRGMMLNQAQVDSYSTCYQPVLPIVAGNGVDLDSTVDGGLALLSQKRANRDKRAMDGSTLKDATFYRFHFDDELSLNENRPWWGRPEY